jgi:hypothetical protein
MYTIIDDICVASCLFVLKTQRDAKQIEYAYRPYWQLTRDFT